jgi:hypothetical protein
MTDSVLSFSQNVRLRGVEALECEALCAIAVRPTLPMTGTLMFDTELKSKMEQMKFHFFSAIEVPLYLFLKPKNNNSILRFWKSGTYS